MIQKIIHIIILFSLTFSSLQANVVKYFFDTKCTDLSNNDGIVIGSYNTIRPKIGLALSGGGSRGFAQIGVIKSFEENNIPIDYIIGTSIGAIVAGLYSSGYSATELDSLVNAIDWDNVLSFDESHERSDLFLDQKLINDRSLLTLRFQDFEFMVPEAISLGNRFTTLLQKLIWNSIYHSEKNFNKLKIPFAAIATNIVNGTTIVLDSGDMVTALRASSLLPLRYSPIRIDSMVLVDGGLFSNIPSEKLSMFSPDIKIAVNTTSPLMEKESLDKPWTIADQVLSVMMKRFSDSIPHDVDYLIQPALGAHSSIDFSNLTSLIDRAKNEADIIAGRINSHINSYIDSMIMVELRKIKTDIQQIKLFGFEDDDEKRLSNIKKLDIKSLSKELTKIIRKDIYRNIFISQSDTGTIIEAECYPKIKSIYVDTPAEIESNTIEEYSGEYLNCKNLCSIHDKIISDFRDRGYSFIRIDSIDFNSDGVLKFFVSGGLVSDVKILGINKNDYLIKRELEFSEGLPLNSEDLIASYENILSLDYIGNLTIVPTYDINGDVKVDVFTETTGEQTIRFGLRIDNERYTQLGIDAIQENLFNLGTRLNLRLAGGLRNLFGRLKIENPRIFNTYFTNSFSLFHSHTTRNQYKKITSKNRNRFENENVGEYYEEEYGVSAVIGTQMEKTGLLSAEMNYKKQRHWFENEEPGDFSNIMLLVFSSIFDTENDIDFPSEGSLLRMSLETTPFSFDNFTSFSKVSFFYRTNLAIMNHIIKPKFKVAFADESAPLAEYFSLGGQDDFFGMREDEMRGRQIFSGSIEYQVKTFFNIFFDTYFSIRYDLGSTWEKFETIKFSSLKHGVGTTIAIDTPIGPAKFSLGRSFTFLRNPNAISWGNTIGYFSIGTTL